MAAVRRKPPDTREIPELNPVQPQAMIRLRLPSRSYAGSEGSRTYAGIRKQSRWDAL